MIRLIFLLTFCQALQHLKPDYNFPQLPSFLSTFEEFDIIIVMPQTVHVFIAQTGNIPVTIFRDIGAVFKAISDLGNPRYMVHRHILKVMYCHLFPNDAYLASFRTFASFVYVMRSPTTVWIVAQSSFQKDLILNMQTLYKGLIDSRHFIKLYFFPVIFRTNTNALLTPTAFYICNRCYGHYYLGEMEQREFTVESYGSILIERMEQVVADGSEKNHLVHWHINDQGEFCNAFV